MSVIRIHRKEKDFFTVKREALENINLSFKAKGLWAYAMSRKDDWNFHVSHLIKVSKEKKAAIYSAIKELIKEGYCLTEQGKGEKGRWETVDYVVFETLEDAEDFKKSLPHSGFRQADNRQADNQQLVKNESSEDRSIDSPIIPKGDRPSSKKAREEKKEMASQVFLTPSQHCNLLERLKGDDTKLRACYDKLSVWKISKGKGALNDYLNIIRWVIKAVEEDMAKPKPIDRTESDKSLAEKIGATFPGHRDIVIGYNYIEFNLGRMGIPNPHLKFGDNAFQEQVENNLRKMGLSL